MDDKDLNNGFTGGFGDDVAQSTSAFPLSTGIGSDADESLSGQMFLFDPSNTTFVSSAAAEPTVKLLGNTPLNPPADIVVLLMCYSSYPQCNTHGTK